MFVGLLDSGFCFGFLVCLILGASVFLAGLLVVSLVLLWLWLRVVLSVFG